MNTSTKLSSALPTLPARAIKPVRSEMQILLTGGFDKPYAYGISMALASHGIRLEVIGSDEVDNPEMHSALGLIF